MEIEIIKDNFDCTFADLIDKTRFEVIKTERENVWLVKKVEEVKVEE
jgi:hypothetical protein